MQIVNELLGLSEEERGKRIDELVKQKHEIPYSKKDTLSRATIYRWIQLHKQDKTKGNALIRKKRSDKSSFRKLTPKQKKCIVRWRYENTKRTCKEIRNELIENEVIASDNAPSISVIARFLKSISMDRKSLAKESKTTKVRMAFEADYPNQIWQIDTKGQDLQIQSRNNPNILEDVVPIVLIDDFSRFIVYVKYVYKSQEVEQTVMEVVMRAIELYGVPEVLYTDRGGPYMGKALKKALNILGCRVNRTPPKDGASKGKCERVMPMYTEKLDLEIRTKPNYEKFTIDEIDEFAQALTAKYHQEKHESIQQTPYERYLMYQGNFRRFVSNDLLALVFLPRYRSKVSKDNLIRINSKKYLMPVIGYDRKFVEVRTHLTNQDIIYVWDDERFLGVAEVFSSHNDYLKRHQYITQEETREAVVIPDKEEVPKFQALDRKLQEYRKYQENKNLINEEIELLKKQRAAVKTEHTKLVPSSNPPEKVDSSNEDEFSPTKCIHLFSTLLRRVLTPHERFSVHRLHSQHGPFEEAFLRRIIGKLLGESCPTNNIELYLDEIRMESVKRSANHGDKQNDSSSNIRTNES